MAFLDNSGDIILDAVLTDTGRMRLAKGDGSFNITKFAFADDEINYELYNKNHISGSAYYDIEILQTPVLEAFTNNTSTMKSKLLSISRTNLLYLPIIKRNTSSGAGAIANNQQNNILSVMTDKNSAVTDTTLNPTTDANINGYKLTANNSAITFDQGIESNALGDGTAVTLDSDLVETQYIIEMDNRLGYLVDPDAFSQATPSFIDDDNIASYYISTTTNTTFFGNSGTSMNSEVLSGPVGTRLRFLVGPSTDLASSTYLFTQIGTTATLNAVAIYQIDSTIRITGATTGFKVDLPIRFIKKQ